MNQREDLIDTRVVVAVSPQMNRLRDTQTVLNQFLWSTEISYGYILSKSETEFPDKDQLTFDVLGHIATEAWFPNDQGRIKFTEPMGTLLELIKDNTVHVYRAVIVYFFSAFEDYLGERNGLPKNTTHRGSYISSLSIPSLTEAPTSINVKTVVCADICKLIRNRLFQVKL